MAEKLVAADAAAHSIEPGLGVDSPLTCFVDEWNGKRPVVVANDKGLVYHRPPSPWCAWYYRRSQDSAECRCRPRDRLSSRVLTVRPQHFKNGGPVFRPRGSDQGFHGPASGAPNCSWAKAGAIKPRSAAVRRRRLVFITMATPSV